MKDLIELVKRASVRDLHAGCEAFKKKKGEYVFNANINLVINSLRNQYLIPSEMFFLFFLASNQVGCAPVPGAVSLSARSIDKIVRRLWCEQMRALRQSRRAEVYDFDEIPF